MTEFDWVGYARAMQERHHWTTRQTMEGQTFTQLVAVLVGEQKLTVTKPGQEAGSMIDLREQINRRRAAKGLPPMKPAPKTE